MDIESGEPLKAELEAFYAACLGRGMDVVSFEEALAAMRVANQVQQAVAASLQALA